MDNMQTVVQKLMTDAAFRADVQKNPTAALQSIGVTATPDMIKALQGLDDDALQALATNYNMDKAAC